MGGFGWHNGFPFEWGGGPTDAELIYFALRNAVGDGGAGPEDGIEDCWRQARAIGLAAADAGNLRSSLQALPSHATDALPYYERTLGLASSGPVARRQREAAARWVAALAGVVPDILAELVELDAGASVLHGTDWDLISTTQDGRYYEPRDDSEMFNFANGNRITAWPAYSSAHRVTALLPGTDPLDTSPPVLAKVARARELLGDALPAWMDFGVVTSTGFILDQSPLDLTGLEGI